MTNLSFAPAVEPSPVVPWPATEWLEAAQPIEILRWSLLAYRDKLTMATAFGAEGCSLLAMLGQLREELGFAPDIFNLDTGYQFPQTLALRNRIQKKYGLTIRAVQPDAEIEVAEAESDGPLYKTDANRCCYLRKVVPLRGAVQGFSAWITAIRRDQTPERATAPIVGPDAQFPLVKINPLANWSKEQVWDYIKTNDVPYNPLHDQNYPSIGCWPCTKPVAAGADERSGRWAGQEKRECGIHIDLAGKATVRVTA